MKSIATLALSLLALPIALAASMQSSDADLRKLTGQIKVDGSSTVYPITEAVAEDFQPAKLIFQTQAVQSPRRKLIPPRQIKLNSLNSRSRSTVSPLW